MEIYELIWSLEEDSKMHDILLSGKLLVFAVPTHV